MDRKEQFRLQNEAVALFGAARVAELGRVGGGVERLGHGHCVIPPDGWHSLEIEARKLGHDDLADQFEHAGEPDYS